MKLSFLFTTLNGRPQGQIQREDGRVVLDQQLGIAFAGDRVLTHGEQREAIKAIGALQHALTLAIEEILDAEPAREGGRYVS